MNQVAIKEPRINAMSVSGIDRIRQLEAALLTLPQIDIKTEHVIHGGMYARTIRIPAGVVVTGTLIKIATVMIVSGHALISTDDDPITVAGYQVIPASAGRKQACAAVTDTEVTMIFPTHARTVEDAEREFTDEHDLLFSHSGNSVTTITGD